MLTATFTSLIFPVSTRAYDIKDGCVQTITDPNSKKTYTDVPSLGCLSQIIVNIIDIAFVLLGFIAIVFLLMGAIKFVISRGDPKAIQSAQKTMTFAIAGVILICLSFVIINIITTTLGLPDLLKNFTIYQP